MTTSFLHIVRDRSLVRTDREVTIVEERRALSRPRHGVQQRVAALQPARRRASAASSRRSETPEVCSSSSCFAALR